MNKDSLYQLQRIDCNCNDCGFMWRDMDRFKQALEQHRMFQFEAFELKKKKLLKQSDELARKGKYDDAKVLFNEADKMKFQSMTNKTANIQYGFCEKFNKDLTFIPNTCQLETQKCFVHRKDYVH